MREDLTKTKLENMLVEFCFSPTTTIHEAQPMLCLCNDVFPDSQLHILKPYTTITSRKVVRKLELFRNLTVTTNFENVYIPASIQVRCCSVENCAFSLCSGVFYSNVIAGLSQLEEWNKTLFLVGPEKPTWLEVTNTLKLLDPKKKLQLLDFLKERIELLSKRNLLFATSYAYEHMPKPLRPLFETQMFDWSLQEGTLKNEMLERGIAPPSENLT